MLLARIGVVIPAAGQGKRMGANQNKLFLNLQGEPILAHTLQVFEDSNFVQEIVIVSSKQDQEIIKDLVKAKAFSKVTSITLGGNERQESVFAGVKALSPAIDRVAVHDGARPLLTLEQLNRFFTESIDFSAAIMAVAVKDTIKEVDESGRVLSTPARNSLRAIQTPQIFDRTILEEAHQKAYNAGFITTDDAALIEWLGYPVQVLEGSMENIKVTTPEDLIFAEAILKKRIY